MSRGKRRPIAGRNDILAAARALGIRDGWKSVTIRSVAHELGYTSPLLYEHFRDKEDLLTHIAVDGLAQLESRLKDHLPADPTAAVAVMAERYWTFMLEHTQLYRLMNGMDGAPVDRAVIGNAARSICDIVAAAVRPLLNQSASDADAQLLADELWALLHGMASLFMDRLAPFTQVTVTNAAMKLIEGSRLSPRSRT